ncbi:MAG: DUF4328 domain-containing protein [Phycisphaerales bacterium]
MDQTTAAFRPSKGLTTSVVLLLGASAFLSLVAAGSAWMDVEMLSKYQSPQEMIDSGEWIGAGIRAALIGIPSFFVWVATVICFCIWIVKASKNARALGAQGMQITPGWAAGWFFIPLANLVMPFKAVSEIWKASEPEPNADPTAWKRVPATPVAVWWSLWVTSAIIGGISFQMGFGGAAGIAVLKTATYVQILGSVVSMLCAFAAVTVVRGIQFRQEHKASLIASGAARLTPRVGESVNSNDYLRKAPAA